MIDRLHPRLCPTFLASLLVAGLAAQQTTAPASSDRPTPIPDGAPAAMAEIDQADLRALATHLASDELQGRYTGTPGQFAAADFVKSRFEELGLEPLGDEQKDGSRSYLQSYPLVKTHLDPQQTALRFGDDELTRGFGVLPGEEDSVAADGHLVYLGYGRAEDIPETLADGAIPLVLLRTSSHPGVRVEAQFMLGLGVLRKASQIAHRLEKAGAPAVLFGVMHDDCGLGELLNYVGLLPDKPNMQFEKDQGMAAMVGRMGAKFPLVFLCSAATQKALASAGYAVDATGNVSMTGPPPAEPPKASVHVSVAVDPDAHAVNAVAVLRGSDPHLKEQAVVFSAHMDHLGTRFDGDVFNGADDNGSGTSALLEIAEAFAKGERPRRSIVFLSVSGEELGLWGSEWFAQHPTWPLSDIAADVNIDMIGRIADLSGEHEISITPSYRHPKYSSIAQNAAELAGRFGMALTVGDKYYQRSDHYNFARRGVPVVFFCDGEHEDYHQVTDTADKLDYAKMERVARLAYWTAWEVAQADERPAEIGRRQDWLPEPAAAGAGQRR